ncbi:hypothetical protein OG337_29220 [[Kitasatospora] papulosa]|uniref:hypothetical protein n=1 Tax=[Kitasatospora] papulosa TaxID=1464011 RepID=UPI00386ED848|nr:hypothetical protein OG337_29220 [[Kitasatospora] papulosa]
MSTKSLPEPNGTCWCGCREIPGYGRRFAPGHDKTAEAAYMAAHHDGSVAQLLHDKGYAPGGDKGTVRQAALDRGGWQLCPRGCGYAGAPASIANHVNRHHKDRER